MMGSQRLRPAPVAQDALGLLRAYEPILRYTRGELFLPTAVGPYVAHCSLWGMGGHGEPACIVPAGALSLERLCDEAAAHQDEALSLRFVQEPLRRAEYRRWRRTSRGHLRATTRFTTTGMFGRLIDAGFRVSLLLRGKVEAGLAAAAEVIYREELETDRFTYYGHVVRDGGYVCLQYWFFYAMNDWRSTFSGVNDHEADWELVTVYLAEQEAAPPRPAWVAYSSHDHQGADLRRRWDDPELRRQGEHPIVFPGAGSHSGAFVPGDYVITVDPPQLRKLMALGRRLQHLLAPWRDETRPAAGFGIPFVDYARGDGTAVGPGQEARWTAALIDDETPWVRAYQGLWGLDTKDHFGGERAPSGPRYERDGSVRPAWANPLGWAGLLTVPPRDGDVTRLLADRVEALEIELSGLDEAIARERSLLRALYAQVRSLQAHDHARGLAAERRGDLATREEELNEMIAARTRLGEERRTHLETLSRPPAPEAPQAHIRAPHGPHSEQQERRTRFLRLWGVVSTPLLLACVIVVLIAQPLAWITMIVVIAGVFIGVEAFARRRLWSFVASTLLLAAAIALGGLFVVLFRQHWRIALSVVLGVAATALLAGNLADVRHAWRRHGASGDEER